MFYVFMSLKRRMRAAHGREARPNLTVFTFMVLEVFKLMEAGGGGGGRGERNVLCV
jgi:hypothetical protein